MTEGDEPGGGKADGRIDVVTAFLRNRSEVLLLRRSENVGSFRGQWGAVSGYAEGGPDEQVRREISEETGLSSDEIDPVRSGRPLEVEGEGQCWRVHPYLFDAERREIELSEEHMEAVWLPPTEIPTGDRETVPGLREAYERVAPTVHSIAADDSHGAATLSIRALEVLRDRAGLLVAEGGDGEEEWDELADLANRLVEARPSMAVLRNRVNRAMAGANDGGRDPSAVLDATIEGIDRAYDADDRAAENAAAHVGKRVLTLSRSSTVERALRTGDPDRVFVAESRPGCEGRAVAEELTAETAVTLHTDAAVAHLLARESVDTVLVGADTVLPDGRVVNKTGTRATAIAAAREGVPVYAVAARAKVSTRAEVNLESGPREVVYDGDAPLDVINPIFDVTPVDCMTGIVTEADLIEPGDVEAVADELRGYEAWRDR